MADKAAEFKKQNAAASKVQEREVDGKKEYLDDETNEWVGKNELKKREKARKGAKAKAEKDSKKADEPKKEAKKKVENDDDLDPSKYTDNRKAYLESVRADGKNPYPHKFKRDFTLPQFREKYEEVKIDNGKFLDGQKVSVTGRIMMIRASGAKLIFIDLHEDSGKI